MVKPIIDIVIARIGLSVQNNILHLKVGRSALGAKLNVIKLLNLRKDQNYTIISSICNTELRGNVFV